jgi:hypothetical protein
MVDVGGFVIDISLAADGDTIQAPAGQVFKVMFYGSARNNNNSVLTLADGTTEAMPAYAKSSGVNGISGWRLGDAGHDEGADCHMVPIFIDETVGVRLDGARSDAANMINVTYLRIE